MLLLTIYTGQIEFFYDLAGVVCVKLAFANGKIRQDTDQIFVFVNLAGVFWEKGFFGAYVIKKIVNIAVHYSFFGG